MLKMQFFQSFIIYVIMEEAKFVHSLNLYIGEIGGLYIAQGCLRRNSQKNISFYCSSPKGK
uniref:Uncharacterized protein n=1 Tax=Picea glauca TaxID=3330 RepID=A0A101M084_PICGL|nr:hypothetical protein ABT39_MTgene4640 [Picea glauca]QHR92470.1 hypothetical protein Q903MT_gene6516 [Picea sitchensis]